MSEKKMTLEQAIGHLDASLLFCDEDAWEVVKSHLTRAPVQVTDEVARDVAECLQFSGWATGGDFEDDFLPDVRRALEYARLARPVADPVDCRNAGAGNGLCDQCASGNYEQCRYTQRQPQPVAVNGLTPDLLGEWCNTLTHAYMYVNERSLENAKHGIELVLDDLREWQEKLSQPHPQAAQGGEFQGEAEPFCYAVVQKNRLSQGAMYRTRVEALADGLADWEIDEVIPLYTHPPERAAVPENVLDRMCQAFYENKGSMKWEKLMDCWKDNYRSNMRAALSAAPTLAGKEKW